eukprot:86539-Chlamydomonas_euryale.AAC.1
MLKALRAQQNSPDAQRSAPKSIKTNNLKGSEGQNLSAEPNKGMRKRIEDGNRTKRKQWTGGMHLHVSELQLPCMVHQGGQHDNAGARLR